MQMQLFHEIYFKSDLIYL